MGEEIRVKDEITGGEKGQKIYRFDLLPVDALFEWAKVYGIGAGKYDERNWERGYKMSLSMRSLIDHALDFWDGEDMDSEGFCHLGAVMFHAAALMRFSHMAKEAPEVFGYLDDRPIPPWEKVKKEEEV